jgi:fluoride ion exporter CrcB/FEX
VSRRTITALLVAFLHAALAALCWMWFDFSTDVTSAELAYLVTGALLLGALPTALLTSKRLLSPAVVVAVLFTLSAYSTWSTYVAPATPPAPVDPTPFGWYLLGWPAVGTAALLVGGVEYGFRRYRQPTTANGTREV